MMRCLAARRILCCSMCAAPIYTGQAMSPGRSLPHGKITERSMRGWSDDTLFVVYCAGPHCNGAKRAALRLSRLGRPVKEMTGGVTGWADEGFSFATGEEPGRVGNTP